MVLPARAALVCSRCVARTVQVPIYGELDTKMKQLVRKIGGVFLFLMSWYPNISAQTTADTLAYDEYINYILQYHPLARQANLKLDLAAANQLAARGNLDPKISADWTGKDFDDKIYYNIFQTKFQIPTRMGLDITGGYEYGKGDFLNPENKTNKYGLVDLGVEVNLLQGLWVNERRTQFEQAEIFAQLSENQRQIMLNELVYFASLAYLNWQRYEAFEVIFEENIELAEAYFDNTKAAYLNGEKAAIDTLEAQIIRQDAITLQQYNLANLTKAKYTVENFLWYENAPIELRPDIFPQNYRGLLRPDLPEFAPIQLIENHPILLEKINKMSMKEVDIRLKREKLKPKLKAKYNPLLATADEGRAINYTPLEAKWGVAFSMPIPMRSERADVQRSEIALQEIALDLDDKRNELLNKIENSWAQLAINTQQIDFQEQNVENYLRLLEGENEKFLFGESSVFLINKRQEKYINGRLKLIDLLIKQQILRLEYRYFAGAP